MKLPRVINIEILPQSDEQKAVGAATYRAYIDNAWRNVERKKSWMHEEPAEFIRLVTEAFDTTNLRAQTPR